jgi:hypothetical protein
MGVGGERHAPVTLPRKREPVPILQEAGWPLGWCGKNVTIREYVEYFIK